MDVYKSIPQTLMAQVQYDGKNYSDVLNVAGSDNVNIIPGGIQIFTIEKSWTTIMPGWWVILSGKGIIVFSDASFRSHYRIES
jgi:hypothetical protein